MFFPRKPNEKNYSNQAATVLRLLQCAFVLLPEPNKKLEEKRSLVSSRRYSAPILLQSSRPYSVLPSTVADQEGGGLCE